MMMEFVISAASKSDSVCGICGYRSKKKTILSLAGCLLKAIVPELNSFDYPKPIVVHEDARKRCLEVYGKALKRN